MTPKKPEGMLMKLVLLVNYFFSKNTDLCLPFPEKLQKTFAHERKS